MSISESSRQRFDILPVGTPVVDIGAVSPNGLPPILRGQKIPHASMDTAVSAIVDGFDLNHISELRVTNTKAAGNVTNVEAARRKLRPDSKVRAYVTLGDDEHTDTIKTEPALKDAHFRPYPAGNAVGIVITSETEPNRVIFSVKPDEIPGGFDYEGEIPRAIYLTSVGGDWAKTYTEVVRYAKEHDVLLAVSPGSLQLDELEKKNKHKKYDPEKIDAVYTAVRNADVLFVNKEEALTLLGEDKNSKLSMQEILVRTKILGAKVISITDGPHGSYTINDDSIYYLPAFSPLELKRPIVNTLGAGDAYAAAFLQAYIETLGIEEAMRWGSFNAAFVIREPDAHSGQLVRDEMEYFASQFVDQPLITSVHSPSMPVFEKGLYAVV